MNHLRYLCCLLFVSCAFAAGPAQVLIVVGPSKHPPGSHEAAAGGRLMKHCIETMANVPGVKAAVVYAWPDKALRDSASTVVFIGDTFPVGRFPNAAQNLADLDAMRQRGCGSTRVWQHSCVSVRQHSCVSARPLPTHEPVGHARLDSAGGFKPSKPHS